MNVSLNLSAPLGQKENSPTKMTFFSILLWCLFVVLIACFSDCVLPSFRKLKIAGGFIKNFTMKFSFLQLQNVTRINTALLFLCQVSPQKQIFSSMNLCQKSLVLFWANHLAVNINRSLIQLKFPRNQNCARLKISFNFFWQAILRSFPKFVKMCIE